MAQLNGDDLDHVVDGYFDLTEFDQNSPGVAEVKRENGSESWDSDFEDDCETSKPKTDTSAHDARNGKDIQGIPWERFKYTREEFRQTRLKQYENFRNLCRSREKIDKESLQVEKRKNFYDFRYNTRLVKSTIVHFQPLMQLGVMSEEAAPLRISIWYDRRMFEHLRGLRKHVSRESHVFAMRLRNLIWATSKHDVYLMQNSSVMHWSALVHRGKEVLNVARPIVPTVKQPGLCSQSLSGVQVSSMAVKESLIVLGGFEGELICKCINQPAVAFCTRLSRDDNAITNTVDVFRGPSGSLNVMAANNDCKVRVFDAQNYAYLSDFTFQWSVNNTSINPDGKLLAVLGDGKDCLIADSQSGKVSTTLKGHQDYSFASAWHPNGLILATGNQDMTCRLWDIRNPSRSFAVLKGNMGAIRGLRFTSDGRFLAMAEPADFVHIFDTNSGFLRCQEIDLFGEIAGISFSPNAEALYVGVADRRYGSLLEYNRRNQNLFLDSFF